jgi:hypothetical protein
MFQFVRYFYCLFIDTNTTSVHTSYDNCKRSYVFLVSQAEAVVVIVTVIVICSQACKVIFSVYTFFEKYTPEVWNKLIIHGILNKALNTYYYIESNGMMT